MSLEWLDGGVATEMYLPPLKANRGSSCPHKASRKYFNTVTLLQSAATACGRTRNNGAYLNTRTAAVYNPKQPKRRWWDCDAGMSLDIPLTVSVCLSM